jgi:hypothetical protein
LGILLLVLFACIVALWYDYQVAKPRSEAANETIKNLVESRNRMAAKQGGPIVSADIQEALGRKPTWVEKEPTHTIEWYCWWGKTPLLSTRRHYITVIYVGDKRRFSAQQLNGPPSEDDLPTYFDNAQATNVGPLESPSTMPTGTASAVPVMPMGGPPSMGGKGKGKGKRGSAQPPAGETADPTTSRANSTSTDPANEKPASDSEKPTDVGDKADESVGKPTGEKPAAEKPAEDKPAEEKAETEKPAADQPKTDKPDEQSVDATPTP